MEKGPMNKDYYSIIKYKDFIFIKNYFLFKSKKDYTTKTYTFENLQNEIFFIDILQEIIDHLNETVLLSCRIRLVMEDRNDKS
jgi:hypothetical protein